MQLIRALHQRTYRQNQRHQGFTLLELMISIVIASLLALAVYMVYMATKKNSVTQEGVSEIRDVGFVVLERFDYALKHAGFMNYDESINTFNTANNKFSSLDETRNIYRAGANDDLTIQLRIPRFSNGQEMLACGGGQFPGTINYDVNYQLQFNVNTTQQLICQVLQNGVAQGVATVLADNILRFKVFYQARTQAKSNACDGTWVRANAVTNWNRVCAVYVAMVAAGSTPMAQPANAPTQTFELAPNASLRVANDTTFSVPAGTGNLRPVARMLHKIVYLRN